MSTGDRPGQTALAALSAVAFLVFTFIPASSACATDLLETYRLAQQQDMEFEAARQTLASALEKLPQGRAGLLPSLVANGGSNRSRGQYMFGAAPPSERNIDAWNWTLQLTQPLIRMQNWATYTQAEALVALAQAQYAQASQDLILRTAQAYFDFNVAVEGIPVADSQAVAFEQQLNLAKRGFTAGTNPITDVHEAKARFDLARAQRVAAQNDLEAKGAELERIVGTLPERVNSLDPDVAPVLPTPRDVQAWIALARDNFPAVRGQLAAVEVAEREIAKSQAGHLPSLDMVATYGSNYSSGANNLPTDFSTRIHSGQIGLQLQIPLYEGGAIDSKVREATAGLYKARADLEAARRQAGTAARQAYAGVINGVAQIEALASAVESGISAVKANQVGARLGTRIITDVLNAEQQLYASQRDLIKARYDLLTQGLKLKAAAGNLSEEDIVALTRWFHSAVSKKN